MAASFVQYFCHLCIEDFVFAIDLVMAVLLVSLLLASFVEKLSESCLVLHLFSSVR